MSGAVRTGTPGSPPGTGDLRGLGAGDLRAARDEVAIGRGVLVQVVFQGGNLGFEVFLTPGSFAGDRRGTRQVEGGDGDLLDEAGQLVDRLLGRAEARGALEARIAHRIVAPQAGQELVNEQGGEPPGLL